MTFRDFAALGMVVALFPAWTGAEEISLSSLVKPVLRPVGAPSQADIALSSRWPRPINARDPHDALEAIQTFHADRMDWCYVGTNRAFVQKVKQTGLPLFGTISAELPDGPDVRTRLLGRDQTRTGDVVPNPELAFTVARGDVASVDYREVVMAHCRAMLDAGVAGIQVDDPGMTYHGAIYAEGGYGEASVAAFLSYLPTKTDAAERAQWGLPEILTGFDYRAYAEAKGADLPAPLKQLFLDFHRESLDDFYGWLRSALDAHAGRHIPLSCNNGSNQRQDETPYVKHFDFWVGETGLQYGDPTAKGIFSKSISAQALGKVQVYSPPNDGLDRIPTRAGYIDLTRKLIATGYGCGSPTLVPWDVWRRGPETPRFFCTAEEFGDLYDFIDENRVLLDGYELAYAAGPGMAPWFIDGLDNAPVAVDEGVFVAVRALPGKPEAPVVIHLVDWREAGEALTLRIKRPVKSTRLLIPGRPAVESIGDVVRLPPLHPYGMVVMHP